MCSTRGAPNRREGRHRLGGEDVDDDGVAQLRLLDQQAVRRARDNRELGVGGSSYNPCGATFVPPPPDRVPELLEDLLAAPAFVPPVNLVLATWSDTYVAGLMGFRHLAEPDSPERSAAAAEWLRVFTSATRRACLDAQRYANQIDTLTARWRERLGRVRANSSTDLLLRVLPGAPAGGPLAPRGGRPSGSLPNPRRSGAAP